MFTQQRCKRFVHCSEVNVVINKLHYLPNLELVVGNDALAARDQFSFILEQLSLWPYLALHNSFFYEACQRTAVRRQTHSLCLKNGWPKASCCLTNVVYTRRNTPDRWGTGLQILQKKVSRSSVPCVSVLLSHSRFCNIIPIELFTNFLIFVPVWVVALADMGMCVFRVCWTSVDGKIVIYSKPVFLNLSLGLAYM